ncbi:hypothetical protein [Stenotrophomonas maltophilia]|uniref:hypothetical protein n=1 Tax=Stenotrophomonas maltophilia TaxID=40324 RepID=UPI0021C93C6B|nr:hypothetical protein [Stenotrophomonas maltophilia]
MTATGHAHAPHPAGRHVVGAAAVGHLEDHLQCRRDPALAGPQDDPALFVGRGIGGMHSGLRRRRGRPGFRHQRRRTAALQLAGTQQGHVRAALL